MSHLRGSRFLLCTVKLAVILLALAAPAAFAQVTDPMVGNFSDGVLTFRISGQNGQYNGQFEAGAQVYPFTATGNSQRIDGTYQDAGQLWQFSAVLQGDNLTFQNAGQTFQLARVGGAVAPQQPAAQTTGLLQPGTRLTYNHAVSSTPGMNAGPDARGTAGQGYLEIDIHFLDATTCISSITMYSRGLTSNTLTVTSSDYLISGGGSCADYWRSPATLAAYQAAPGGIETVERGPFQLGGQTYNAISINTVYQNMRSWKVYDLDSGVMLSFVEGSGDRSNPDGSSAGPSTSAVQELVHIRQVNRPWSSVAPLPPHLQSLQSLSYRGQMVQSLPGITMFDTSTTTIADTTFTIQQRGAAWLQAEATTTLSTMGISLPPTQRQVVINANSGQFLLPSAMAQLQSGQVLDTDPITGYRLYVERADPNGVVLVTEGPGYRYAATFDAQSGILLSSRSELNEEGNLRTITTELTGWQ